MRVTVAGLVALALVTAPTVSASAAKAPRQGGPVGPSATTLSITDSLARVEVEAFEDQGTPDEDAEEDSGFQVFDERVAVHDEDVQCCGAFSRAEQLATIADVSDTITLKARASGSARLYDRDLGDSFEPEALGRAKFAATIDVAGGAAAWSLRGRLEAGEGPQNQDCAVVALAAPDLSVIRANFSCDQALDETTVDIGGMLGPGSHTLEVTGQAGVRTISGSAVRASFEYDLTLTVSACTIDGTPDPDVLEGTEGDDVICGRAGNDTIDGLGGDDTIFGGPGGDEIEGGPGDDTIFGADGEDVIQGGGGRDVVLGGPDADVISDRRGPNALLSGDGDADSVCGSHQRDSIRGGDGSDLLFGLGGSDVLDGGRGGDALIGEGTADQVQFAGCTMPSGPPSPSSDDTLDGGTGDDRSDGGAGSDVLKGGPGDDVMRGGPDGDSLTGSTGKDTLLGEGGNDRMNVCDAARDTVVGGPGSQDVAKRTAIDIVRSTETRRGC